MEDFKLYTPPPSQFPTPREKTYHVFLSFRGPDVRKTFVDHLYRSLSAAGLHVFLDSERLEKGEDIGMSLQQAIQNSAIHIPIFSTNYASSPWCLKELHLMCKSKFISRDSTLIPLFYKVEPSDVRYARKARGPYYKAFHKHYTQRRYHSDEIREWESALQKVSGLSGWSLKETAFGYEGRLVKRIVLDVLNTLDITCIDLPKHSVGLEDRREEVIKLLRIDDKRDGRVTVGIWGMGGLGKTTLAKALYNHLHRDFEASSFVSQVRATAEESVKGLTSLQTQILKDLTKLNHMELNSSDHGKTIMRNHLTSVRALVILDDVDHVKQLDALLCDCYGEGSLIIITTRDKNVLEVGKVDAVLYQMKGLEQDEAVELFSWHAFMRSNPEEGFEDMTERIVNACGGLPLSLEIIGSHLYPKKDLRYWRDALQKLVFDDVYQTLKISYNALSFEEKQIFLDIACFFIRLKHNIFFGRRAYNMDFYVNFWSALGYRSVCTSLQNIEAKSLMTIQKHAYTQNVDEDEGGIDFEVDEYVSIFGMHDQIREMGRRIVEEESPNDRTNCSRVWRKEDIVSAMALTEEMPSLRGLMCKRKLELDHMDSVASMPKLQFLLWWNLFLKREIKTLPRNLRYLIFGHCHLKAIEVADSDGRSNGSSWFCHGSSWFCQLMGLITFPSFFGVSKELEFGSCLPKSIGQLKFLRYLDMSGTKQTFLPEEVGELSSLEELYLFRCYLKALPQSFGNLAKLKIVDLSSNLLLRFPESFQRLKSLVDLKAVGNKELMQLSNIPFGLVNLNVRKCSKLTNVQGMPAMLSLESVDLSHCKSLTQLPWLEFAQSLRKLKLGGCEKLEALPYLPSCLTSLDIWGCSQLQEIPDIIEVGSGPILHICFSVQLQEIPVIPQSMGLGSGFIIEQPIFELQANFGPAEDGFSEAQRLCMIGCDIPKINIYGLLEKWPNLELLEVSRTLLEELPGKSKNDCVASPFNFQVRGPTRCKAILFCFVLSSNGENVRVPEMHVEVSGMTSGMMPVMRRREIVKKFKLPQCKYSDGSGKSIIRICILKEGSGAYEFEKGDNMKCWYKVEEPFPQGGCLVREAQVLLLPEEVGDFDDVTQCLRKWKLLDNPSSRSYVESGLNFIRRVFRVAL